MKIDCLSKLFFRIGEIVKEYEDYTKIEKVKEDKEELYSTSEITKIYPKLSKHTITKAISDGELPVTWIGNERLFYLKDVDRFLENHTVTKDLKAWRTNEQA